MRTSPGPGSATVGSPRSSLASRALKVGALALAIGVLIYLASRSVGGGLAGIVLSGLIYWFAFELGISILRGLVPVPNGVQPRHMMVGGCMTVIAGSLAIGLILLSGQQLIWGVILGGVSTFLTHKTQLPSLAQMWGVELMPGTADAGPPIPLVLRPVAVVVALLFFLAGVAIGGLGTVRVLEGYSYAADTQCPHPCAMWHGLWVQVLPDAHGDFVTRLDSAAVQIRMRFSDDVAATQVVSQDGFTVSNPPAIYKQAGNRQGCGDWAPRVLHLGESTGDLTLCFAIQQSQEADFSQLILDWTKEGVDVPILLGKKVRSGWGFGFSTG